MGSTYPENGDGQNDDDHDQGKGGEEDGQQSFFDIHSGPQSYDNSVLICYDGAMDKTIVLHVVDEGFTGDRAAVVNVIPLAIWFIDIWLLGDRIPANGEGITGQQSLLTGRDCIGWSIGMGIGFFMSSRCLRGDLGRFSPALWAEANADRNWIAEGSAALFTFGFVFHCDCPLLREIEHFFPDLVLIRGKDGATIEADYLGVDIVIDIAGVEGNGAGHIENGAFVLTLFCRLLWHLITLSDESGSSRLLKIKFSLRNREECGAVVCGAEEHIQVGGDTIDDFEKIAGLYEYVFTIGDVFACAYAVGHCLLDGDGLLIGDFGDLLDVQERVWAAEDAGMKRLDGDFDDVVLIPAIDISNTADLVDGFECKSGRIRYFLCHFCNPFYLIVLRIYIGVYSIHP